MLSGDVLCPRVFVRPRTPPATEQLVHGTVPGGGTAPPWRSWHATQDRSGRPGFLGRKRTGGWTGANSAWYSNPSNRRWGWQRQRQSRTASTRLPRKARRDSIFAATLFRNRKASESF